MAAAWQRHGATEAPRSTFPRFTRGAPRAPSQAVKQLLPGRSSRSNDAELGKGGGGRLRARTQVAERVAAWPPASPPPLCSVEHPAAAAAGLVKSKGSRWHIVPQLPSTCPVFPPPSCLQTIRGACARVSVSRAGAVQGLYKVTAGCGGTGSPRTDPAAWRGVAESRPHDSPRGKTTLVTILLCRIRRARGFLAKSQMKQKKQESGSKETPSSGLRSRSPPSPRAAVVPCRVPNPGRGGPSGRSRRIAPNRGRGRGLIGAPPRRLRSSALPGKH